jgi:hypothetical protein
MNMWVDVGHAPEPAQHVMVVALWHDVDARLRWEDRFAEVLRQKHVDVTASYRRLTTPMPDSAAVFMFARSQKCDGVIVVHEHVEDDRTFYVPGYSEPKQEKIPRWYRPSGASEMWPGQYPGPGVSALSCDVELWSASDRNRTVWSGTVEVVDPGSDDYAAYEAARRAASELARLGLIPSEL